MIPMTLQLKNFLSYGNELQTIDFNSHNLICFSGKNGHGKSALLDAITWAIWGYARKTVGSAKADQGLLRLGQNHMLVCLDFSCNAMHYRVRRELTIRHNKPFAALDFGIIQHDGNFASLTDKTIRATQAKIEKTINLDFESFCNSAFLRQGQSNEFCKKSPKDRKDILTRILGLQKYETIRRLALEKSKKALLDKQQVMLLKENITAEITYEDTLQKQSLELAYNIESLQKEITIAEQIYKEKKNYINTLGEQKNVYNIDKFALEQLKKQKLLLQNKLSTIRTEWRNAQKKIYHCVNLHTMQNQLEAATQECIYYQEKLKKGLSLKELFLQKKNELYTLESEWHATWQQKIEKQQQELNQLYLEQKSDESDIKHYENKLKEMSSETTALNNSISHIQKCIEETQKLKNTITTQVLQLQKRKDAYQRYKTEGSLRTAQLEELKQKKLLAHKTHNASCPLCEQTVTASRRRFLDNKFMLEETQIKRIIMRLSRVVIKLKPLIINQHNELEPLQKKIAEESLLQQQHKELSIKLQFLAQEIENIEHKKRVLQQKIDSYKNIIIEKETNITVLTQAEKKELQQTESFKNITQSMHCFEQQAAALQYNAQEHTTLEQKKQRLEQQMLLYKKAEEQIPLQIERKKQIFALCAELKALKEQEIILLKKVENIQKIETEATKAIAEQAHVTQTIKQLQTDKEKFLQEHGSVTMQLKKIVHYKQKKNELDTIIKEKTKLYQEFNTIAHAMGKDGIQALLIEEVIPEIEYEANDLLSRLTQNQSQIIIESLKDLKSGGTKETLDIFISDSLGIRPYELFSGGEAFRIDFALRIAISKLVARRAGTSLQTLIIDEGFGSQDEESLGLIMEALYKIQEDFEKIIVVSHLPFIKDHFPVHFAIEKGSMGSQISVLQQG